jgi:hypothetical protein
VHLLKKARLAAANDIDKGYLTLALCQTYERGKRWNDLLAAATELKANTVVADMSFPFVVKARSGLGQWQQLEKDGQTELKTTRHRVRALRAIIRAALETGQPARATPYVEQLRAEDSLEQEDYLLAARVAIASGKADSRAEDEIQRQERSGGMPKVETTYLLGLLRALGENIEGARQALLTGLTMEDWTLMDGVPWVLHGKIQEHYGNTDSAQIAYAKARENGTSGSRSRWVLALIPALSAH